MRPRRQASPPALPPDAPRLRPQQPHLSETQIDDCIIGDLAPAAAAHLAACPLCAERAAAAADPFASFHTLSTTWSERLSAVLPAPVPSPQKPLWQRHLALAAPFFVLVIGITVVHSAYVNNAAQTAQANTTADTAAIASRQSRVSADDRMLDAIETDLAPDSDSPADLGLRPVSAKTHAPAPTSVRD